MPAGGKKPQKHSSTLTTPLPLQGDEEGGDDKGEDGEQEGGEEAGGEEEEEEEDEPEDVSMDRQRQWQHSH